MSGKAVHSAARRYLIARMREVADLWPHADTPLGLLPPNERQRSLASAAAFAALRSLLEAVEAENPRRFQMSDDARHWLREAAIGAVAAWAGDPQHPRGPQDPMLIDAVDEERRRFIAYLENLDDTEAARMPRVPQRRGLALPERRAIFQRIRERWPAAQEPAHPRDWWHPDDAMRTSETLHLQTAWLNQLLPMREFRQQIAAHTSDHLLELWESSQGWDGDNPIGRDLELSPLLFWPGTGHETIWTWRGLDFLIYTDHNEGTLFLGDWLIRLVRLVWPTWQQYVWNSPVYAHPPRTWPLHFPPWLAVMD